MDDIITPDPYCIHGYTGHIPGYRFRCGGTYSRLSSKLFLNPCTSHSPNLALSNIHQKSPPQPDPKKLEILKEREKSYDVVYRYPIKPGYEAHVPKRIFQCGKVYSIESLNSLAEFEMQQRLERCRRRELQVKDVPYSGKGNFLPSNSDRLSRQAEVREPLVEISEKLVGFVPKCESEKKPEPYTKFTYPLFLECGDARKYITSGYMGHIPLMHAHFGHSNQVVTHGALCQYLEQRRRFKIKKWCPDEVDQCCRLPKAAYDDLSCPGHMDFPIYDSATGQLPAYGGHVPGYKYVCGANYSALTANARDWLVYHRNPPVDPTPARIRT